MVNSVAISVKNGSFGYTHNGVSQVIISDLNGNFSRGELVGVVGLNGSGKSTILRSLAGLQPVIQGEVLIGGQLIRSLDTVTLAKKVSIVLTERFGGFNLRLQDLVATGQMPYTDAFNRLTSEHLKVIEDSMKRCQVFEHRHKKVLQLSDGLFQKAMIARALAQQTDILLLDEPTAFLDYASKHLLFRLLHQLATEEKKCVIVSSHDLDLVLRYCNKVLTVSEGRAEMHPAGEVRSSMVFQSIAGGFLQNGI